MGGLSNTGRGLLFRAHSILSTTIPKSNSDHSCLLHLSQHHLQHHHLHQVDSTTFSLSSSFLHISLASTLVDHCRPRVKCFVPSGRHSTISSRAAHSGAKLSSLSNDICSSSILTFFVHSDRNFSFTIFHCSSSMSTSFSSISLCRLFFDASATSSLIGIFVASNASIRPALFPPSIGCSTSCCQSSSSSLDRCCCLCVSSGNDERCREI